MESKNQQLQMLNMMRDISQNANSAIARETSVSSDTFQTSDAIGKLFQSNESIDRVLSGIMKSKPEGSNGGPSSRKNSIDPSTFKSALHLLSDTASENPNFNSAAWTKTLQDSHQEIDYTKAFPDPKLGAGRVTSLGSVGSIGSIGTDFQAVFQSQLNSILPPSKPSPRPFEKVQVPTEQTVEKKTKSPKRKRNPRPKKPAPPKIYIDGKPNENDVLLGRGGRTNHHVGNKYYLSLKEEIQPRYLAAVKDDKTGISQELVDAIHAVHGRFLKLDEATNRWYIVDALTARKKASQTLREINTPENRAAKRAKYNK